jgi:hypothetical protein
VFSQAYWLSVFRSILNRPAWWYGLAYLLLIPVFGISYWLCSGMFYHSSVKYEAYMNHNADQIMEQLKNEWMKEQGQKSGAMLKTTQYYGDTITQNLSTLELFRPEVDGEYLVFDVKSKGNRQTNHDKTIDRYNLSFKARIHATCLHLGNYHIPDLYHMDGDYRKVDMQTKSYYKEDNGFVRPKPLAAFQPRYISSPLASPVGVDDKSARQSSPREESEPEPGSMPESDLPFLMDPDESGAYHLRIPKVLSDRMSDFVQAANGFPSSVDGNLWRMMYFSVTTITTLGFGDIVPLTTLARSLVALEAIFGIILIGMFLNALATRSREPSSR